MPPAAIRLELDFPDCDFGLSARRLFEHTERGQVNVFKHAISERREQNHAPDFIDLICFDGEAFALTGLTVAELLDGQCSLIVSAFDSTRLKAQVTSDTAEAFIRWVQAHLDNCSVRRASRNQNHPFLPPPDAGDVFGVPGIASGLQRRLRSMGKARSSAEQWSKTIENFQKKGLRAEELDCSNLMPALAALNSDCAPISADELANRCDFSALRLSVIPVMNDAQRQLRFGAPTGRKLSRTRNLPKAVKALPRTVAQFDPVLGYRIEQVEHQTLWGIDQSWQAVTYRGKVIRNPMNQSGFQTVGAAEALAATHAKQHFPKWVALGRFGHFAWTGGESYREWLITLPYYPESYLSGHFKVRNVLAHVRMDVREGANHERVLMLHEAQSDWAQRARKALSTGEMDAADEMPPPFMKEWPALLMKLVLLHAAHQGLDAVAWTRGAHQVHRYGGLGAAGLTELYDRTLPREVNRMVKPFGGVCDLLEVFVPVDFSIKQTEDGYVVSSTDGDVLGTGATLEDAQQFLPDGAHEVLDQVHGVALSAEMRRSILAAGFPAWG